MSTVDDHTIEECNEQIIQGNDSTLALCTVQQLITEKKKFSVVCFVTESYSI